MAVLGHNKLVQKECLKNQVEKTLKKTEMKWRRELLFNKEACVCDKTQSLHKKKIFHSLLISVLMSSIYIFFF